MAETPEMPLMDAENVRKLVSDMWEAVRDGNYTLVEVYVASRALGEAAFESITANVEDDLLKRQIRDMLDRRDREPERDDG